MGIVWNLGSTGFQACFMSDMKQMQAKAGEQTEKRTEDCCESDPCCENDEITNAEKQAEFEAMQQRMESTMKIMMGVAILFAIGISALFGWVIWKLTRPAIVAEFKGDSQLPA